MLSFHVVCRGQNSLGAEFQTSKNITEIEFAVSTVPPHSLCQMFPCACGLWLLDSSGTAGKYCTDECVSAVARKPSSVHRK